MDLNLSYSDSAAMSQLLQVYNIGSLQTPNVNKSNHNRANDVAVCVCVCQPTPRTADVTITKMAGYVRVRILMNR